MLISLHAPSGTISLGAQRGPHGRQADCCTDGRSEAQGPRRTAFCNAVAARSRPFAAGKKPANEGCNGRPKPIGPKRKTQGTWCPESMKATGSASSERSPVNEWLLTNQLNARENPDRERASRTTKPAENCTAKPSLVGPIWRQWGSAAGKFEGRSRVSRHPILPLINASPSASTDHSRARLGLLISSPNVHPAPRKLSRDRRPATRESPQREVGARGDTTDTKTPRPLSPPIHA